MRVISGKYRSLNIDSPSGRDVRPTTDRVREAMFSSIESTISSLEDIVVLDAFAGSGALGIESISRGAKHVIFCEKDLSIRKNLESNLGRLKISPNDYDIHKIDSFSDSLLHCLQNYQEKIKLVLLDPPYKTPAEKVFELICNINEKLSNDVLIVYEHSKDSNIEDSLEGFNIVKSKTYGTITIDYIGRN